MTGLEEVLEKEKPDAFLVLGDTNSSLGAILAKRMGIRVFHMEAGNRCFDDKVPEEVNRRLIDHASDILLPYTERSRQNLLAEGIHSSRIYVTGNPITEIMENFLPDMPHEQGGILITLHRAENVDDPKRLSKFVEAFNSLVHQYEMPIVWSVHPHTRKRLEKLKIDPAIKLREPMSYTSFLLAERDAYCVLTDSGTVQEECSILHIPVVTLRDSTERPETVEGGSNFISGCEPESILQGVKTVTKLFGSNTPQEYLVESVSDTVCKIVLGYYV